MSHPFCNGCAEQWYRMLAWQADKLLQLEQDIKALKELVAAQAARSGTHVERMEYHFEQLKVEHLNGTLMVGVGSRDAMQIDELWKQGKWTEDVKAGAPFEAASEAMSGAMPGEVSEAMPGAVSAEAMPGAMSGAMSEEASAEASAETSVEAFEAMPGAASEAAFGAAPGATDTPAADRGWIRNYVRAYVTEEVPPLLREAAARLRIGMNESRIGAILEDMNRQAAVRIDAYLHRVGGEAAPPGVRTVRELVAGRLMQDIRSAIDSYAEHFRKEDQDE